MSVFELFRSDCITVYVCIIDLTQTRVMSQIEPLRYRRNLRQCYGSGSLKRKTSTKIIIKSYLNFRREDLFLLKKCNMAIFYSYKIWSLSKNLVSTLKRMKKKRKKNPIFGQIQAGSDFFLKTGSGAKLSGSATLHCDATFRGYLPSLKHRVRLFLAFSPPPSA